MRVHDRGIWKTNHRRQSNKDTRKKNINGDKGRLIRDGIR